MNFHVHPKGFWLWLKPTQESSELLIDLRNEIIIDNGTKAFPFHLTISKINLQNLYETKLSYDLEIKDFNFSSFDWSIHSQCNNYFQSIYLAPQNKNKFNNLLISVMESMKMRNYLPKKIDPHISLVYSFIKKEKEFKKNSFKISFDKLQIAFVDEKKGVWKYVNSLKEFNL